MASDRINAVVETAARNGFVWSLNILPLHPFGLILAANLSSESLACILVLLRCFGLYLRNKKFFAFCLRESGERAEQWRSPIRKNARYFLLKIRGLCCLSRDLLFLISKTTITFLLIAQFIRVWTEADQEIHTQRCMATLLNIFCVATLRSFTITILISIR